MGTIDRIFLALVLLLVMLGFLIMSSAALGMLVREGFSFSTIVGKQLLAIVIGLMAMGTMIMVPLKLLRTYSPYFFAFSLLATLLVWVPGLGVEHNGAVRWISIAGFSVQPAEIFKISAVIFFAAWLSTHQATITSIRGGVVPFLGLIGVIALALLSQPDTDTFLVIVTALMAMFVAAGARFRDLALIGGMGIIALGTLIAVRPYLMRRLLTFLDPSADPLGAGYQVNQSLIAVGSGEWFGRGYGQSIQKFNFLPEPIGDSIFSVAAEEFGFIGAVILIALFITLAYRGLKIARESADLFGGLVTLGLVILIVTQSFLNIASMIGAVPLTGLPLVFVSKGGSAMIMSLISVGVILHVSRNRKRRTFKRPSIEPSVV